VNLPNEDELVMQRKGLRKQKPPKIFDGMWASEPGIGGVKFSASSDDFKVEWVSFDAGVKSELKEAMWKSLCVDTKLARQRLEIGFVLFELFELQARKVMESVGHPITAFNEAKPYRAEAKRWKHWGVVLPGYMLDI
jgi:hypothetical protein